MRKSNVFFLLLAVVGLFCILLKRPPASKSTIRHMSDSLFRVMNDHFHSLPAQESRRILDSLYSTFPFISIPDKYHYIVLQGNIYFDAHINDPTLNDTSQAYADRVISLIEENGMQKEMENEYMDALQKKSSLYTEAKRYEEAINVLVRCAIMNKESGNFNLLLDNIISMAYIAYYQHKYDVSIARFKEALLYMEYCKTPGMRFFLTQRTLDDLGVLYNAAGIPDSALRWHLAAENYILANKTILNSADSSLGYVQLQNVYENIAQIYLQLDSLPQSRLYIQKAVEMGEKYLKNDGEQYRLYQTFANICFAEKKYSQAEQYNKLANAKYPLLTDGYKKKLLYLQARIDSVNGRYAEQANTLGRLISLKDSVNNDIVEALKKDPQAVYEQMDKKRQVDALKHKAEEKNLVLAAALIITLLLGSIALLVSRNLKRSKKLNAILKDRETKLEKLLAEIEERKESEKKQELFLLQLKLHDEHITILKKQQQKISEDMHDELASSLAALRYYIADIRSNPKYSYEASILGELEAEVHTIYESARRYMYNLRGQSAKRDYDIAGFLNEVSKKFAEKELLSLRISLPEKNLNQVLTNEQFDNLYFVVKEGLSNIIKHSGAKNATISIQLTDSYCLFTIEDDGRGADTTAIVYGIGVNSIQNRIYALEGEISIDFNKGTKINGKFPLENII